MSALSAQLASAGVDRAPWSERLEQWGTTLRLGCFNGPLAEYAAYGPLRQTSSGPGSAIARRSGEVTRRHPGRQAQGCLEQHESLTEASFRTVVHESRKKLT